MKKTLLLILSILLFSSAWAYDFSAIAPTGQTLYYNITSSAYHTVEVTYPALNGWSVYTKPTGNVIIPSSVSNNGYSYSVTSIGDMAFYSCGGMTSITIPNSVTSIGSYAFSNCYGLTSLTIPNSVSSIGNYAFCGCSELTSITIPNSVTSIGNNAFSYCPNLSSIIIGSGVFNIGTEAFLSSPLLNTVTCYANTPPSLSGNSSSFCNCGHTVSSLIVPCGRQSYYSSWSSYFSQTSCVNICTINILTNNSSYGTVSGGGTYVQGSSVTITTIPNNHFHFERWSDNITTNPRTLTVSSNMTLTAIFAIDQHSVSVSSNNSNWGSVTGNGTYDYGSTVTLQATPQNHCHFVRWSDNNTSNPRTLMVNSDTILTAHFAIDQHSITINTNNPNWGIVTGAGNYDYGSSVTITATPFDCHYHFSYWSDGDSADSRTITLLSDTVFTAIFGSEQYSVTVTSENPTMGSVNGGGVYDYYSTAILQATAYYGHHFVRWSDNNVNNPRNITVLSDTSISAIFAKNQYNITVISGNPEWGNVEGSGHYDFGSNNTVSATPVNHHFYFSIWNDGNADATRTITLLSDTSFTAYFGINQYAVIATSANPDMGFVTGGGVYDYGSTATVIATPYPGYQFLYWNDDNTNAEREIIVTEDVVLTAYFGQSQSIDSPHSNNSDSRLIVFPNPAKNTVSMMTNEFCDEVMISIYDLRGRMKPTSETETTATLLCGDTHTFTISNWTPGVYLIKASFPDGTFDNKKLIVR